MKERTDASAQRPLAYLAATPYWFFGRVGDAQIGRSRDGREIAIYFDSYHDRRTSFEFAVTPGGAFHVFRDDGSTVGEGWVSVDDSMLIGTMAFLDPGPSPYDAGSYQGVATRTDIPAADETGTGEGAGANHNYPMRWGTGWEPYREALEDACGKIAAYGPDALVISLGVDTFKDDPISKFRLESENYLEMGAMIAGLGRPTLFVMEGGYAVEAIGINAVNVLTGFEGAA